MTVGYLLFLLTLVNFGGGAVLALAWAISSGQMENVSAGANSIFGADEPIGEMTDTVLMSPSTSADSRRSARERCAHRGARG